jgi:hypothetical protein
LKLTKYLFTILIFSNSLLICQELQYNVLKLDSLGTLGKIKVTENGDIYLHSIWGLYKSTNNGASWKQLINSWFLQSFDIDKDNIIVTDEVRYDSTSQTLVNEIIRRKEVGDSLQVIDRHLVAQKYSYVPKGWIIKTFNNFIYAAITQPSVSFTEAEIIRRDSGSNTWSTIYQSNKNIYKAQDILDIYPVSNDTILIALYDSVQTIEITCDSGKNWKTIGGFNNENSVNSSINSITVTHNNTIIYGSYVNGIYRSTDFGNSWANSFSTLAVFKLLKYGYPEKIFAFSDDLSKNDVYMSLNDGMTWSSIPSNKQIMDLKDAYIDTNGQIYLISGNSLYIPTSVVGIVKDEGPLLPAAFKLIQNYPNPFNPTTIINYSIPKESFVTIKVYDLLGRELTTLVSEEKNAGEYSVKFNGSKLASGVYLYRMQAGNFIQTKKLVLIR